MYIYISYIVGCNKNHKQQAMMVWIPPCSSCSYSGITLKSVLHMQWVYAYSQDLCFLQNDKFLSLCCLIPDTNFFFHRIKGMEKKYVVSSRRTVPPQPAQWIPQRQPQTRNLADGWWFAGCDLLDLQIWIQVIICWGHRKIEFMRTTHIYCKRQLKKTIFKDKLRI